MSNQLSAADQKYLSAEQQAQIKAWKEAWSQAHAAGDQKAMTRANQEAEAIRAQAGYTGGSDGSGYSKVGQNQTAEKQVGGKSAQEVQKWVDDYYYTNYDQNRGWVNGYSTDMNLRSMANYIRQQMQANSDAWADADTETRAYLHDQNKELAQVLSKAAGGVESIYNEDLGRWETWNGNLGYGYNHDYDDIQFQKDVYGMTDEQIEAYRNDTDRYRNFVDQRIIRNWYDESSGYTGLYGMFVNGPYAQLLTGSKAAYVNPAEYVDTINDGQGHGEGGAAYTQPKKDADGNFILLQPYVNGKNAMDDYTRQFASYVDENGVIQPGMFLQTNPAGRNSMQMVGSGVTDGGQLDNGISSVGDRADSSLLDQWKQAASQQAVAVRDHAVDTAVQELLAAQTQANAQYQTQRDQIAREERNALDNSALYAETRGDRGGIGQAQYNTIQATAAANRQTVSAAQTQLAADTARQVTQLRAEGEFEKAEDLLEISQTYLLKLLELEKWAAEYQLDTAKFQQSVSQWQQEFLLKAASALV